MIINTLLLNNVNYDICVLTNYSKSVKDIK